ncbi:MAG: heme NO-binding domain-containing protein [Caldilineaceae bacterium]
MKGMIFTEFLEMVEETFSLSVVDRVIDASNLPSGGAYTAVGTYPHSEMVELVVNLSKETNIPVATLLHSFGTRLFQRFAVRYAHFLANAPSAFAFLEKLESYVHAEVKKLYPEAELPKFECTKLADGRMTMLYRSQRSMADIAHGLMEGCFQHFGEKVLIEREDLSEGKGALVRFVLTPVG